MNRREVLQRVGILMGGAVSASAIAGLFTGCRPGGMGSYVPQTLTATQYDTVAILVELIIPTTDTPGARAAGAHEFIDRMITHIYTDAERTRFLAGLTDLESRARARGSSFLESPQEAQIRILEELEAEAISARSSGTAETSFFHSLKELTLIGYYTSEIGAARELKYVHAAGSYDGDVPFEEIGKAYS